LGKEPKRAKAVTAMKVPRLTQNVLDHERRRAVTFFLAQRTHADKTAIANELKVRISMRKIDLSPSKEFT